MSDTETIEYQMEEGEEDTLIPPSSPLPPPVREETRTARRPHPYRRRGGRGHPPVRGGGASGGLQLGRGDHPHQLGEEHWEMWHREGVEECWEGVGEVSPQGLQLKSKV